MFYTHLEEDIMGRTKVYTEKAVKAIGNRMIKFFNENETSFFIGDFCVSEGFGKQRISEFANEFPFFSEQLKQVKMICESRLLQFGMSARNPTMSIFVLKCQHDWSDVQKIETKGSQNINISYNTVPTNKD